MIEGAIKYVRQAVMEEYLVEFLAEWEGEARQSMLDAYPSLQETLL